MDLNDMFKVWQIRTLRKFRESEAREILENIAKLVQPIMCKHKWKVKVLSEFCHTNTSHLGLNVGGGAEVKIRLRRPDNELDFFPYNQILDTMLHELCHNEYRNHNTHFYNLLDEIRQECEKLMLEGITAREQGLDIPGTGRNLDGFSHQPPVSLLLPNALTPTEQRAQLQVTLTSGIRHVAGENSIRTVLSHIQTAAVTTGEMLPDDVWCESKSWGSDEGPSQGSETSVSSYNGSSKTSPADFSPSPETTGVCPMWQCSICTLANQLQALSCEACGIPREGDQVVDKSKVWSCKFCTLNNNIKVDRCLTCGEWRYSYGPPVTARGPHLGI